MTNKKKNENTKVVKKEEQKLDSDIKNLIKMIIVVGVILLLVFGLTMLMSHFGVFDKGYTRLDRGEVVISYEDAVVGTVFNRKDATYYVAFDEFGDNANQYLGSVLNRYVAKENSLPVYKVDMSSGFNSSFLGDESNPSAQKAENIKISGPTLIKIVNGKNVMYIEGVENIEKELLK